MSAALHDDYYGPVPSSPSPTFSFALGATLISISVIMFLVLLWWFYKARKRRLQGSATHRGADPPASPPSSTFPNFHPHIQNVYNPSHPRYIQTHGAIHSAPYSECHPQKPPAIAVLRNATQNFSHKADVAPMGQSDFYSYRALHQSDFHSPRLQVPFTSSPLSLSSANLDHPALLQYSTGGTRPGTYRCGDRRSGAYETAADLHSH